MTLVTVTLLMIHFQKQMRAFDFADNLNIFKKQIGLLDISSDW